MSVEAVYMGPGKDGSYRVNVKNANPTGMIGDAGVIRRFDSKKDAKDYAKMVNKTKPSSKDEYQMYLDKFCKGEDIATQPLPIRHEGDVFVKQSA